MSDSDEQGRITLRERLQGLMAFRVALVTVFLGGTLAVDVGTLASLSNPRNLGLLVLVVATYLLTIVYALLLRRREDLLGLARFQIAADFALTALLVALTGGLESIFLFLFYVNIINTAVVAGRTTGLYAAGAVVAILFSFGTLTWYGVPGTVFEFSVPTSSEPPIYFQVVVDAAAALLIALLSGRLVERLGETTVELEQKRVDLQRLRALTQDILASLDSGVVTVDPNGEIIYANEAADRIAGFEADQSLQGRPIEDVFLDISDRLEDESPAESDASSGYQRRDARNEFEYERPDGDEIYLGYSISVLRDSRNRSRGHILVFQDLTDIKRLKAEKERSQRLAAIGELAASIAHEIRNPLASISGSVEMLEGVAELDGDALELMEIIVDEVERLDDLISEFLEYSRPSELSPEFVDLRELVEDVVDIFENRDSARELTIECRVDSDVDGWRAAIDRESIRQVLWNLLNNAVDALEEVPPADRNTPEIRVSLSGARDGDQRFYDLTVEDAGPGIDAEQAERLFEPFYTTKREGSGLGLATAHRLVEKHGGRLQIADDSPLGGAAFVVRLLDQPPSVEDAETTRLAGEESAPSLAAVESSSPVLDASEPS